MSRVIHKKVIPLDNTAGVLKVPREAFKFLYGGEQNGQITVWYETIKGRCIKSEYRVAVVGTGFDVPARLEYLSTIQMSDGFVWHLYGEWV